MKYADIISEPVPQSEPLNERQVKNNAGGFVFAVDDWTRLDRFLVLGSDAPTYYQNARELTLENAKAVKACYAADPARTVARVVEISDAGRALKNDPAIFALAIGASSADLETRRLALGALPKVARTSTHLFQFVKAARALGRGWGRSLKRAVADWYRALSTDDLAYQAIKYREREGFTHKRLLQTSHPKPIAEQDAARLSLIDWMLDHDYDPHYLPARVRAHIDAMKASTSPAELCELIQRHNLPWEAIPTEAKKDPTVWQAMLPTMGLTALVRNLGVMTAVGALRPLSEEVRIVLNRLNAAAIHKARLHPFNILQALAVYRSGHGFRGSTTWSPIPQIIGALDAAFYLAFEAVEPSNKRVLIGLDVSGSMGERMMDSALSVREGAAAMAMTVMRTEPAWHVFGFTDHFEDLKLSARDSLTEVVRKIHKANFGRTDCAQPMLYAMEHGLEVDVFQIYTDNETWFGRIHPVAALRKYREKTGIPAKLIVVGMTSSGFSIADPKDGGMLDVVGFDSAAPAVMADFARQ